MKHISLLVVVAAVAMACGREGGDRASGDRTAAGAGTAGAWLETPFPITPFEAIDLDGRDQSPATWKGRVVIVNAWATWCGPCRREMPALSALAAKYSDRVLVLGLLQDTVTTDFARAFARGIQVSYPIVRSTFEIESRFPPVLRLPTTFLIDPQGRLVAMRLGEVDPAMLDADVQAILAKTPTSGGRIPSNTP